MVFSILKKDYFRTSNIEVLPEFLIEIDSILELFFIKKYLYQT